jgi:transcription elongation factor Elf1
MVDEGSKFPFQYCTQGQRSAPMGSLLFTCPNTNQQVSTGVETNVQSLRAAWTSTLKVNCQQCGQIHEISVRDTYLNGALDDAVGYFRQAR